MRRTWARRMAGVCVAMMGLSSWMSAQGPAAGTAAGTAGRLPVKRVILYKNGIGYFEHLGRVTGNQPVAIEFTSGQLNDVLKSLTALDLSVDVAVPEASKTLDKP